MKLEHLKRGSARVGGWRRCGLHPARISVPVETLTQSPLRASLGSDQAYCGANAHEIRRARQSGSVCRPAGGPAVGFAGASPSSIDPCTNIEMSQQIIPSFAINNLTAPDRRRAFLLSTPGGSEEIAGRRGAHPSPKGCKQLSDPKPFLRDLSRRVEGA